jgi:hypothetical protein
MPLTQKSKKIRKSQSKSNILELFNNSIISNINHKKSIKINTEKLKYLHKYPEPIYYSLNNYIKTENIDDIINKLVQSKNLIDNLRHQINEEIKLKLDRITQNISHNLSTYINKTYFHFDKIKGVSNAYLKLWEIYQVLGSKLISSISKSTKEKPTFLHMCEAPGNWIKSTRHYMMRFHPLVRYTWFANSLNPASDEVKRTYGRVFQDELQYMRKYPSQWLFGSDNTGDITRPSNISHIAKMVRRSSSEGVALITGDAGLDKNTPVEMLQRLEIAQFIMSVACNMKGGCCIIKNFASSYGTDYDKMKGSIPYLVSLIMAYQEYYNEVIIMKPITSNPISSEYYLIGIGFKGITTKQLEHLYKFLTSFQPDTPLDIDSNKKDVKSKIETVIVKIYELNNKSDEILNVLMECFINQKENTKINKECNNYLENSIKFEKELFKEWIKKNKYSPISF